jgi:hypothetical protein
MKPLSSVVALTQGVMLHKDTYRGIFTLTTAAQSALQFISRRLRMTLAQVFYQPSELQEIRHPEQRTVPAQDDFRVRRYEIRPLSGHGADGFLINPQKETPTISIRPLAQNGELLPAERVERMSDPHKACRCDRTISTPN